MEIQLEVKILDRTEYPAWNNFVSKSESATLLSFWQWGEAQSINKEQYRIIAVNDNDQIILGAICMIKPVSGLGNVLYIPYGPNFLNVDSLQKGFNDFYLKLKSLAEELDCFAIEIEPFYGDFVDEREVLDKNLLKISEDNIYKQLTKVGFSKTNKNFQARYKLLYDLDLTEEELMNLIKKKTRYNVRLARKKGVEIKYFYPDDPAIGDKLKIFYKLLQEMQIKAKGYPIRPYKFFMKLFELFQGTKNICLIEASFEGETIAMNISEFTKSWASSFYAAANRSHSNLKAPYLLRWASVMLAKDFGSKVYDFWGIVPGSRDHAGYSDIKVRFGGYRFDTTGIWAMPINKWKYLVYKTLLPVKVKVANVVRKLMEFIYKSRPLNPLKGT